jgi:hypothetical protein
MQTCVLRNKLGKCRHLKSLDIYNVFYFVLKFLSKHDSKLFPISEGINGCSFEADTVPFLQNVVNNTGK